MQISKQSKDNMLFFLNDAETYLKKIGPYQQRRLDIILGKLYKDIYNSDTYVDTLVRRGCLKAKRARISNLKYKIISIHIQNLTFIILVKFSIRR